MAMTDVQWAALAPLVEACRPRSKRPPRDLRRTLDGILWRHRNGATWRAVPSEYGAWWRAVATRYEKTKASFLGVLCLAATADWLKS